MPEQQLAIPSNQSAIQVKQGDPRERGWWNQCRHNHEDLPQSLSQSPPTFNSCEDFNHNSSLCQQIGAVPIGAHPAQEQAGLTALPKFHAEFFSGGASCFSEFASQFGGILQKSAFRTCRVRLFVYFLP
jgi:hypothetical protein